MSQCTTIILAQSLWRLSSGVKWTQAKAFLRLRTLYKNIYIKEKRKI
jgi:hypothetical protein